MKVKNFCSLVWLILAASAAFAQTTAFTYQGKLTDAGNPANGNFDLQFKLFDTPTIGTGTQAGATFVRNPVTVSAGVFTVTLDFSANVFDGAARYLEIGVRPAGNANPYTILAPRQPVTSTPYAIQTLNAQQLGGVAASEYITNTNLGTNVIRNQTTLQTPANFNISGNGFVGGNLGVGTTNPLSKLMVLTPSFSYGFTHTNGTSTVGSYVDTTGGWLGTRSNHPLHFFTNGSLQQMTLATNGHFGIGTITPTAKLTVSGSGVFNSSTAARFDLFNTVSGNGFLQNVTDGGLFQIATTAGSTRMVIDPNGNVGVGTAAPQAKLQIAGTGTNGFTLGVEGNVTQNREKGGFAKAMVYVNGDGTILRCYNGLTGASTGNCGFAVTHLGIGNHDITTPFQINDRFYSVSVNSGFPYASVSFQVLHSALLRVSTFTVGEPAEGSDRPFMLIVY
jgi:hypothetical protein